MAEPSLIERYPNQAEVDFSRVKIASIAAFGVVFAGVFGFFLANGMTIWTVIAAALFLVIAALQPFFIKGKGVTVMIIAGESLAMTVAFIPKLSGLVLLALASVFLFLWWAHNAAKAELANQLKVQFFRPVRRVTNGSITALALFVSFIYLSLFSSGAMPLTKAEIGGFFYPSDVVLRAFFPTFSSRLAVSDMADNIVAWQAEKFGDAAIQEAFKNPAIREKAAGDMLRFLQNQAATVGVTLKPTDTLVDAVYNFVNRKTSDLNTLYKDLDQKFIGSPISFRVILPLIIALFIFVVMKGVTSLLGFAVYIPAYFIFETLIAIGFAEIFLESRSREIILLKKSQ